jgi:hypothetical protein
MRHYKTFSINIQKLPVDCYKSSGKTEDVNLWVEKQLFFL